MELREFVIFSKIEDSQGFAKWLESSGYKFTKSPHYDSVDYWDIDPSQDFEKIVADYLQGDSPSSQNAREAQEQRLALIEENKAKDAALAKILITSGFTFDGYKITKYSGYISGDDVIQVARGVAGFGATKIGEALSSSLVQIRRNALRELKEAAHALGCNAVIGVDFDYITLDPQTANLSGGTTYQPYVFCVTANGNAVNIEKELA